MARDPVTIRNDIHLAGRFVAEQLEVIQRRGWLPFLLLGGAAVIGLALSRRPAGTVARAGVRGIERALQVAAALAAIERFRERLPQRQKRAA